MKTKKKTKNNMNKKTKLSTQDFFHACFSNIGWSRNNTTGDNRFFCCPPCREV